ncbi:MAG: hypothetical protein PUJ52_11670 [Firmicutes bacterium]|nr:hypothetical protein [Bacillota bacterium]
MSQEAPPVRKNARGSITETGLVPRYPTLIVSGFLSVAAIQLAGIGISLQNMLHKNRQDFELELYHAEIQERTEKDCK